MHYFVFLIYCVSWAYAYTYCEKTNIPLELGIWKHHYKNLDSTVVENNPVSLTEGQMYVYDNYFPGYMIKYIHVDNLAVKTCGATASIKSGGIGTSSVFILLHAGTNQEIRSVVDIWGEKSSEVPVKPRQKNKQKMEVKNLKSLYLAKGKWMDKYVPNV